MKKRNIGSSFESWLHEEGLYEEVMACPGFLCPSFRVRLPCSIGGHSSGVKGGKALVNG